MVAQPLWATRRFWGCPEKPSKKAPGARGLYWETNENCAHFDV